MRLSPDRWLSAATLLAFAGWLATVGPVRTWASGAGLRDAWLIGVAPSLLAAVTMALWIRLRARSHPMLASVLAVALTAFAEAAQVWMPRQTADPGDVVAGVVGGAVAWPLLRWHANATARRALNDGTAECECAGRR